MLQKILYGVFTTLVFGCAIAQEDAPCQAFSPAMKKEAIVKVLDSAADWQLANPSNRPRISWVAAPFYNGLMTYYTVLPNQKYLDAVVKVGFDHDWKLQPRPFDANVYAMAQTYLAVYELFKDPKIIDSTRYCMEMRFSRKLKHEYHFDGDRKSVV